MRLGLERRRPRKISSSTHIIILNLPRSDFANRIRSQIDNNNNLKREKFVPILIQTYYVLLNNKQFNCSSTIFWQQIE